MQQSDLQVFAALCYRLLLDDPAPPTEEELSAVRELCGGHFNAEEVVQLSLKVRRGPDFAVHRAQMLERWQGVMPPAGQLSDRQAQEFLDDYFNNPDHPFETNILFDYSLIASRTYSERGRFGDRDVVMTGAMPCWILHLTDSGQALYISDRMEKNAVRGDLMLFQPNAQYRGGIHPAARHWEHFWVMFQPPANWQQWMAWEPLDSGIRHLRLSDGEQYKTIKSLLEKLIFLKNTQTPYTKELQYNALEELLIHATAFREAQEAPVIDRRIDKACEFIEQNCSHNFRIDDIARACNLSPSRLAHLFKEHMGVSLKHWHNNIRLQQARRLLLNSDLQISQIAGRVGFEDPNLFAKTFKKNIGCTPREFRSIFCATAVRDRPASLPEAEH